MRIWIYLRWDYVGEKSCILKRGNRKGKYLFDRRQNPRPLTDNICAISVCLVATLNVHKLISDACSSLAKFGLILCKAHVLPLLAAFQSLILFSHFLAFDNDLFWNNFVVHRHYQDPFVILLLLKSRP